MNNHPHPWPPNSSPSFNKTNIIEDFHLPQAKYDQYPYLNYEYNYINLNRYNNECYGKPRTYEFQPPYSINK
jgi:hypothetical protein